ncbi:MAG: rhodanese family protein [Asticcacaulis sp.]|nr:rhodanese family protein [Asticcacaulis sp.]
MRPPSISPKAALDLMRDGALLVDIRETPERQGGIIAGARHHPLSTLVPDAVAAAPGQTVIFHCRSGRRTTMSADNLRAATSAEAVFLLDGGIDAWTKSGLPVSKDQGRPIALQRQVMIAAGALVLSGIALSVLAWGPFLAIAGFVGAGLLISGVTGSCTMARLLTLAPWNRI